MVLSFRVLATVIIWEGDMNWGAVTLGCLFVFIKFGLTGGNKGLTMG